MPTSDEEAIRKIVSIWMEASIAGDTATLRELMDEDVVFLTAGNPPMRGRDAFVAAFQAGQGKMTFEGHSDIQELCVAGDVAWMVNKLRVTATFADGRPAVRRSGHTLTVFCKKPDGRWVLKRDANLLTPEPAGS